MLEDDTSGVQNSFFIEDNDMIKDRSFEVLCSHERKMLWVGIRDGRRIVLKGLPKSLLNHPEEEARLRKEYLLYTAIDHPGVVRVHGFLQHQEFGPVIEMEYIDGVSLHEYLHHLKGLSDTDNRDQRQLPNLSERRRIACDIADTLAAIHDQGITHRDLKPDNIMITRRDRKAKIIDLGNGDSADYVIFKKARATMRYGSPEMRESSNGEPGSDVYSFGRILDELLPERRYRSLRMSCLDSDPSHRPTMKDVLHQLNKSRSIIRRGILWFFMAVVILITGVAIALLKNGETNPAVVLSKSPINPDTLFTQEVALEVKESTKRIAPSGNETSDIEASREYISAQDGLIEQESVENRSPEEIEKQYAALCDTLIHRLGPIPVDRKEDSIKVCWERDALRGKRYDECLEISKDLARDLKKAGVDSIDVLKSLKRFWDHYGLSINKTDNIGE